MIKAVRLTFITEQTFQKRDAEKLRGYFGTIYKEEDLFHNHSEDGKSIYRMPLIQYKVINVYLSVTAYERGVDMVADKFLKINGLIINNEKIDKFETEFSVNNPEFQVTDTLYEYTFESLWLPIN